MSKTEIFLLAGVGILTAVGATLLAIWWTQ